MISILKDKMKKNPDFLQFMASVSQIIGLKKNIKGKKNKIINNGSFFKETKIKFAGSNNQIILGKESYICNCNIELLGDNNKVIIGDNVSLVEMTIRLGGNSDRGNLVKIGNQTTIRSNGLLRCSEGGEIIIGKDCMFSTDTIIRNGDGHSIVNEKNGQRVNRADDILIGDHVWLGEKVIITKGASIASNSIVGIASVVTNSFNEEGVIIAGIPATIIQSNRNWLRQII